jgi:hypothetical protein
MRYGLFFRLDGVKHVGEIRNGIGCGIACSALDFVAARKFFSLQVE